MAFSIVQPAMGGATSAYDALHTGGEHHFVHWSTMSTDPTGARAPSTTTASVAAPSVDAEPTSSMHGRRQQARPPAGPVPNSRPGSRKPPPRRKRKVRKVHRVVRHVEVWSIAKLAAVFAACGYVVSMISGYLLWQAADRVGTLDGIEGFMEDSGSYDSYDILGGVVFRVAAVTGVVIALALVAVTVLAAVLFNLISDITGGIRMTVIDEDLIVAPARRPGADAARRPGADAARRPEADAARRPEADPVRRTSAANGRPDMPATTANEPVGE